MLHVLANRAQLDAAFKSDGAQSWAKQPSDRHCKAQALLADRALMLVSDSEPWDSGEM
jgi:hypothetical protein